MKHRLKIIINNIEADYVSASDLNLTFNRYVDDFRDLSKRFGEFSYEFTLPDTKKNNLIFKHANVKGRRNIFSKNKNLECKIYDNDNIILEGSLSLTKVSPNSFGCVLFSKLKTFNDDIQDKSLRDLNLGIIDNFTYEEYIVNHIEDDNKNSDDTIWQFPLVYYGTYFTPAATYSGKTDYQGREITAEDLPYQLYYYLFNSVDGNEDNRFYHHQIPPAFYIVRIMKQIFNDAGWKLSGQFFDDENIKRIVMLYAGDNDIYDQATGQESGSTAEVLTIAKLLPDLTQTDFVSGIINMFNLYFTIDAVNKVITFETYNTFFSDTYNPYDISDKGSLEFTIPTDPDPSIRFADSLNKNIQGDNYVFTGTTNYDSTNYIKSDNVLYDSFFNYVGTSEKEIKLPFAEPTMKRTLIWNDVNVNGITTNHGATTMTQPLMSKQSPTEDNNSKFNKKPEHTYLYNTEDTIKHQGKPMLMYYYGMSGDDDNYINIYYNSTLHRVRLGICSPFQLLKDYTKVEDYLNNPKGIDNKLIQANYLYSTYKTLNKNNEPADFSLVFDKGRGLHKTLFTKFYELKNNRYLNNEILSGSIKMTIIDWNEMQINRPVKFNDEIYHIISIQGFNPITETATITLVKD